MKQKVWSLSIRAFGLLLSTHNNAPKPKGKTEHLTSKGVFEALDALVDTNPVPGHPEKVVFSFKKTGEIPERIPSHAELCLGDTEARWLKDTFEKLVSDGNVFSTSDSMGVYDVYEAFDKEITRET